jgi:hypothetical protein
MLFIHVAEQAYCDEYSLDVLPVKAGDAVNESPVSAGSTLMPCVRMPRFPLALRAGTDRSGGG